MGIDIYMRWKGQEEEEHKAQITTGYSVESGDVGYLREAYHGGPFVTRFLVSEAFAIRDIPSDEDCMDDGYVPIPAKVLRERLNEAVKMAVKRQKLVYKVKATKKSAEVKAFIDFVKLAERKEEETGQPVEIYASF